VGIEIECVVVDTEGQRRHGGGALVGVDGDDGAADVGDLWLAVVDLVERPCRSRKAEQLVEGCVADPERRETKRLRVARQVHVAAGVDRDEVRVVAAVAAREPEPEHEVVVVERVDRQQFGRRRETTSGRPRRIDVAGRDRGVRLGEFGGRCGGEHRADLGDVPASPAHRGGVEAEPRRHAIGGEERQLTRGACCHGGAGG